MAEVATLATEVASSSPAIRPEYVALANELDFLRSAFRLPCSDRHRADVVATLAAFECIDRHYDATAAGDRRSSLGKLIVDVLGGNASAAALPSELADHVSSLRATFEAHAAARRCAELLAEFFATTERVRTTRAPREYLDNVRKEGWLTSAMVLLVLDPADESFAPFFLRLGVVGNLVDKLCDIHDDHALGEIAMAPTAAMYARLLGSFAVNAVRLLATFPRPFALARWGLKYLRRSPQ